jgi:Mn-dependent DtxR family transcriptional regulator
LGLRRERIAFRLRLPDRLGGEPSLRAAVAETPLFPDRDAADCLSFMSKTTQPQLTQSIEDYLERIYELIESKGYARVSDIADSLKLSRPSVTIMVQRLSKLGFVVYEKYRGITLTAQGQEVARRIRCRHVILTEFFSLLGLDLEVVAKDVEGIEHHLSSQSLARLELIVKYWRKHPSKLERMLDGK